MSSSMIQLPRTLHYRMHGLDVMAMKGGLVHAGVRPTGIPRTIRFSHKMQREVRVFQTQRKLQVDGVIGPKTYAALYPYLGPFALQLLRTYVRLHAITAKRDAVHAQFSWLLANHASVYYAQIRPVSLARFRDHVLPITSDCSGSIIGAFFAAGAPDPGGNAYTGDGNTASFLSHLRPITRINLREGDIVVFGWYPGVHAVCVLDAGDDPLVYTHGHEGVPDNPATMRLSVLESYFASVGVPHTTYLSCGLP